MGTLELLILILVFLAIAVPLGSVSGFLWILPTKRWAFDHRGHRIEVRNFLFGEQIAIDGVPERNTCVARSLMQAEHEVELPDGIRLRVHIEPAGRGVGCRVEEGGRLIFDSAQRVPVVEPVAAVVPTNEDPRLVAARILLADVAAVDARAAATLDAALAKMVTAERTARATAVAHEALGGHAEDTAELIAERAADVDEMLVTLRRLHLRVVSGGTDDLATVLASARDAVARIAATSEVDPTRLRRSAQASRQRSRE